MTKREWKTEALHYLIQMNKWLQSNYRQEKEYAIYLRQFFFGNGDVSFEGGNETWQMRMASRELPMPLNAYLYE